MTLILFVKNNVKSGKRIINLFCKAHKRFPENVFKEHIRKGLFIHISEIKKEIEC
jgi:hypothetical protein